MKINLLNIMFNVYNKLNKKNIKYIHTQKYHIKDYFKELLLFSRNSTYWSRYKRYINVKTLNNKHNEFVKMGLYKEVYNCILYLYYKQHNKLHLKYQSIDSLFVKNKLCIMKPTFDNKQIGRNKFYKNKKGLKITTIIDDNYVPISFSVNYGNSNDAKLFDETFNNLLINPFSEKYYKLNKYKQYFLGDSGYDTLYIRNILKNKKITPIIDINNRNTKDINKRYLTKIEKKKYIKRIKVENYFGILTQYPKMNIIIEKTIKSFEGFLFLVASNILYNKI